jgi:hypothetical protein
LTQEQLHRKPIAVILLLAAILIAPAMAITGGHWDSMTVEKDSVNGHTDGLYTSIVIDKNNIPHVSWVNEARNQVEYGTYKDDIWTVERVGPIDSRSTGRVYYTFTTSIALDPQGNPAISYAGIDGHLYYAFRETNGTWTLKDVDGTATYKDQWSSLKFHPLNGKPYIAFTGKRYVADVPYGSHLSLAYPNGDVNWKIDILETSDDVTYNVGYEPSLAFTSDGKATVVYRTGQNTWGHKDEYTRIARQHADNTWGIYGFSPYCGDHGTCGFSPSLALDSEGNAHFTGTTVDSTQKPVTYLEYFRLNTTDITISDSHWIQQWNEQNYAGSVWNSLVFDPAGKLHVSYYDPWSRNLKYFWLEDNGYSNNITVVDEKGDVGKCNALAFDSRGNPWISYHDATNNAIKVSRWVPDTEKSVTGSWKITTVANGGGGQTSIALDFRKNPHISYYNATDESLNYAERDSKGTWKTQTVADFHQGQYSALALIPSTGNACIGYYDEMNQAVNYVTQTGPGTWNTETVEKGVTLGDDGGPITLVLDSAGNARLTYYDTRGQRMSYAQQTGTGTWDVEKVDAGKIGQYPSIVLHPANNVPAISYLSEDGSAPKLKYVDKTSGLWVTNDYDLHAAAGPTSLAMDSNAMRDRAEIAYTGSADGNSGTQTLGYIEIDPDSRFSWKYTVDNWDEATQNVWIKSLSLRQGRPGHAAIAYYYEKSTSEKGLKYAAMRWGNWNTEKITDNAGEYLSMVLDAKGTPYISYYDAADNCVKLAVWEKA